MGDIGDRPRSSRSGTAATRRWCTATGRSGDRAVATSRPSPCGLPVPRATWSGRPASSATTSPWPRSHRSTSPSLLCAPGRTVLAQRVTMTQEDRPVLEAMVWSVGAIEGLEHEDVEPPMVPIRASYRAEPTCGPTKTVPGSRSGTTSTSGLSSGRTAGHHRARSRRRGGPGCVARLPRSSTTLGWTRLYVDRARRGQLARRPAPACPPRPALHRSQPRPVRVVPVSGRGPSSGCSSMRTRPWPTVACSVDTAGCGHERGG